jgi:hypothetical protein
VFEILSGNIAEKVGKTTKNLNQDSWLTSGTPDEIEV